MLKRQIQWIAFTILLFFCGSSAHSADIKLSRDGEHGCIIDLVGEIEEGDAQKLVHFLRKLAETEAFDRSFFEQAGLKDPDKYTYSEDMFSVFKDQMHDVSVVNQSGLGICLNSTGGSFAEAIKIYDLLRHHNFPTVILGNSKCYSACAIIFMAGNFLHEATMGGNSIRDVERFLFSGGRLGVHAPALPLKTPPLAARVREAYNIAIQQNAMLLTRFIANELPVLKKVLSTPPDDLFVYDTVERTIEIDVDVVGVVVPKEIKPTHVISACANASRAYHRIQRVFLRLGELEDQSPLHWQCESPATGVSIPGQNTATSAVKIREIEIDGEMIIVGDVEVDDILCNEGSTTKK